MSRRLLMAVLLVAGAAYAEPPAVAGSVREALAAVLPRERALLVTERSPLETIISPMTREQKDAAKTALKALLVGDPSDAMLRDLHTALGLLGDYATAAQAAAALAQRHPNQTDALRLQAASLIDAGDYRSAAAVARRAYEAGDQAAFGLLKLAEGRVRTSVPGPVGFENRASAGMSGAAAAVGLPAISRDDDPTLPFKPAQRLRTGEAPADLPNATRVTPKELDDLLPAYALANYSTRDREDLAKAISASASAANRLHRENPSFLADKTQGWSVSGALANIPIGVRMLVELGAEAVGMKPPEMGKAAPRSCIDHVDALTPAVLASLPEDSRLKLTHVTVGREFWFEHHVLMLHPEDTNPVRSGAVLDPWRRQTDRPGQFVMAYTDFKATYPLEVLGGESHQEVTRARR